MLPPIVDEPWPLYGGDPADLPIDITEGTPAVPVDLSGRTFNAQWRPMASSDVHEDLTVDMTSAGSGRIILRITGAQTAAMGQNGVWDVQEVGGPTLVRGRTTWEEDVTR